MIAPDVWTFIFLYAARLVMPLQCEKILKISGPTRHSKESCALLAQTDYMKPRVTAVFVVMDWAEATLNMAELPDFPFFTFHYAHLTHSYLNRT